jgi:hypothetical protein
MKKMIQFGEKVEGYSIPVLNEREIRAAAGILFALMFTAIFLAASLGKFTLLKYAIIFFLADILIRVLVNPRFAPTLIMGRWIVRKQVPEYVGAKQKKFAWKIGIALSSVMFALVVVVNSYSPITGLICLTCLIFLFFESAFGICLGCKFYPLFYKEKVQYCPGEVCEVQSRHEIQKISRYQLLIVFSFVAFIILTVIVFHDSLKIPPFDLFGLDKAV